MKIMGEDIICLYACDKIKFRSVLKVVIEIKL